MYCEALKSSLRLTAQLNEFTLIFNVWIVSPTIARDRQSQNTLVGAILRSIGYSISETLYTLLLARIPADPAFILLMTTVLHGSQAFWLWFTVEAVADFRQHKARRMNLTLQAAEQGHELAMGDKSETNSFHPPSTNHLNWNIRLPLAFAQLQTAAASNAALLLAAQNADITQAEGSHTVHAILLSAGLFYFFASRLGDCYFARVMGFPLYFGQHRGTNVVIPQVANLLLIVLLRGGVRWFSRLEVFAGAWGNDAQGVGKFVGLKGSLDSLEQAPRWLSPVLLLLSPCLMYLSGRFSAKARTE